ncbi:nucleotidyltransferase family protein [Sediminibacterium goheungense]|uniref:Molybdenum cofactor cytidylyltransferase n=1 Tax=Sediminibacterium goheungense TaxID=1086393 RepID=A0A4R6IU24_9BACT|nr:nucleotidyltransferase family protein [Sediminibacterium goheungense]TDO25817.1 molybdenum cofactor cytidylyltransferase [Sediminibacterium goheungense]
MKPAETALLILAAGASRRLGRPKQQLLFHNQTLLNRIIGTAMALNAGPVVVVVGEDADRQLSENMIVVPNPEWTEGMASSIRIGIKTLQTDFPSVETVIIMVCDQPYVSTDLLQEMIDHYKENKKPVIACTYADTIGTPVLFHKEIFPELMELRGDKGARVLINKESHRVGLVNFPQGNIDIDTEEDYERLIK